jgi:hypothetical protein
MLKWIIGIVVALIVLLMITRPEWLNVLGAIFSDFIQANEK